LEETVMNVNGVWRIVEMDLWDAEAIDLLGPGYIQFSADQTGHFRFIAVEGWMDCHSDQRDGRPCVEFTWEGNDESDPASGRGWAALDEDGSLRGHTYFHLGDARASGRCVPRLRRNPRQRPEGQLPAWGGEQEAPPDGVEQRPGPVAVIGQDCSVGTTSCRCCPFTVMVVVVIRILGCRAA